MPYDQGLKHRVDAILLEEIAFISKNMFGGICYLLNGNMLAGIINDELIVRAGKNQHENLLKYEHTKVFNITGKVMKGWILVEPEAFEAEEQLAFWLHKGIDFASSLPPK